MTAAAKLIPDGMHQTLNPDSLTIRHTETRSAGLKSSSKEDPKTLTTEWKIYFSALHIYAVQKKWDTSNSFDMLCAWPSFL